MNSQHGEEHHAGKQSRAVGHIFNDHPDFFFVVASESRASLITYGESASGFNLLSNGVSDTSSGDLANGIAPVELVSNLIGSSYGDKTKLTDGLANSSASPFVNSYIPQADTVDDAIVQIDLGSLFNITQINSYSQAFGTSDRAWQGYKVYGSNLSIVGDTNNNTTAELAANLTLLAAVNTASDQNSVNEKFIGVSVTGLLGNFRYIIFDFQRPIDLGVSSK